MAALTCTQTGNWSASATWGGSTPAASDTFTIGTPYTVTVDVTETDNTKLYGRINVNTGGTLTVPNGKAIAVRGWVYVNGGTLQMDAGSSLRFSCTDNTSSTEGTGLVGINANGATAATKVIIRGTAPYPETTLSGTHAIGVTSLSVVDGSTFGAGEHITVYKNGDALSSWTWTDYITDEGFTIHHVSGNTLYLQQRVPIRDTLNGEGTSGNDYVYVNNITKWQPNQKVFIGTSDNNVYTIESIDVSLGKITFTGNLATTYTTGSNIIETGSQKAHASGDAVSKLCACVTTAITANTTADVVVSKASGIVNGDKVVIEGDGLSSTYATEYTVQSVATNTITLTGNVTYNVAVGAMVVKTNRDTVISTTTTDQSTNASRCVFLFNSGSGSGIRCSVTNTEFSRVGNTVSWIYYGVVNRGQFADSNEQGEIRGCVIKNSYNYDYMGVITDNGYHFLKNNVMFNCNRLRIYNSTAVSALNNIIIGPYTPTYSFEIAAIYYYNCIQYNIVSNANYGFAFDNMHSALHPVWHNIFKHINYPIYIGHNGSSIQYGLFTKNSFQDVYRLAWPIYGQRVVITDNEVIPAASSPTTTKDWATDYSYDESRGNTTASLVMLNHNFERGNFKIMLHSIDVIKDTTIHMGNGWSYKFYIWNYYSYTSRSNRLTEMVFVRANEPVTVVAYARKNSTYNGSTRPKLVARGFYYLGTYTQEMANVNDEWQRVELTFTPPHDELIGIGLAAEGSAGNCWFDPRVSVKMAGVDLINGPFSINKMFGLQEDSSTAALSLGSGILL